LGIFPQLDVRMESNTTEKGHDVELIATQAESSLCPVCRKGHMKAIREIPWALRLPRMNPLYK
jgi:hypothetical protein